MPATSAASLALAARLRELDDAALARVIRERALAPGGLRDIFDLAEALLDPAVIDRTLAGLTRPTLAALATAAERDAPLTVAELAAALERDAASVRAALAPAQDALLADLVDHTLTVWPAVAEVLAAWPARGLPDAAALRLAPPPPVLAPVDDVDRRALDRAAADRAFGLATAAGELLRALADSPARLLSRGGLALPESKRLAAAAACALEELPAVVDLLQCAGLVVSSGGALHASAAGTATVAGGAAGSAAARWRALAEGWLQALPAGLAALLAERVSSPWSPALWDLITWLHPAGGDALLERMRLQGVQAERLGLVVEGWPSILGGTLLTAGGDAAAEALAPLLPPEVDKVYLQHDLTVVSPGPLAAAVDAPLRRMADIESAGLAGRYRISAESVSRAIAAGETAESLLAFLHGCSLTGVPQPVQYLIEETARRFGTVRVRRLEAAEAAELGVPGARTLVGSDDAVLLEALTVDTATATLGLRRVDAARVVSRLDPAVVLATLVDARYPAVGEQRADDASTAGGSSASGSSAGTGAGGAGTSRRDGTSRATPAEAPGDEAVRAAVARIRAATSPEIEGDGAWVARQWQLALRGRLALRATVQLPDGSERAFELEPTGIAAGRVRGRDRIADVERTLPVASITALEPLDE